MRNIKSNFDKNMYSSWMFEMVILFWIPLRFDVICCHQYRGLCMELIDDPSLQWRETAAQSPCAALTLYFYSSC
jgi:hypothetical protein